MILCGHTNCGAVAGSLSFPPDAPGTVNLWLADLKDTAQHHAEMIYHEGNDKEKTDTCVLPTGSWRDRKADMKAHSQGSVDVICL